MNFLLRAGWLLCLMAFFAVLPAQNIGLDFAADQEDFVNLPLSSTALGGDPANYTIECWFNTRPNPINEFRRLFSLGGSTTRVELGVLGGQLVTFIQGVTGTTSITPISVNTWYHLTVVKTPTSFDFYLDCNLITSLTIPASTTFAIDFFRLGRWPGGTALQADWNGVVDELRLWSRDLSAAEICDSRNCQPTCTESGLFAYWSFDDPGVIPGGNNTAISQVLDCSPLANHGTLNNFVLNGPTSNFVNATTPLLTPRLANLSLEIRDYPARSNILTGICSGDPAHFCLLDNGQPPGPAGNVSVQWEYSDNGGSWLPLPSPPFTDFCFPIQPGVLTLPCSSSPDGFVDRKFRAITTVTDPVSGNQCTYVSSEQDLQICCPVSPATVTLNPAGPYCEGETETFTYSLNSPDPWVMTPGPNVTINWFYNDPIAGTRTPLPGGPGGGTHTVTFPQVPGVTSFCFEVEVTNCNGKMGRFEACVSVDPEPVCGDIDACPLGSPQNLTPVDLSNPAQLVYEICPGDDAVVCMATPFSDCIPQWQYTFDDPQTVASPSWVNLGLSNTTQNTNILPSHLWPAGQTSIYYRVQCNPLSTPSGCDPCFSNIVEITLIQAPLAASISGPAGPVCVENLPINLTVAAPQAGVTYNWICNGLAVGTGNSYSATEGGCYWLEASNGCQTTVGPQYCVEVCELKAAISCPLAPNECACLGGPITLSAIGELDCSLTPNFTCQWLVDGGSPAAAGATVSGCSITHIPAAGGTTYTVTITDSVTGCTATATRTVVPCDTPCN